MGWSSYAKNWSFVKEVPKLGPRGSVWKKNPRKNGELQKA